VELNEREKGKEGEDKERKVKARKKEKKVKEEKRTSLRRKKIPLYYSPIFQSCYLLSRQQISINIKITIVMLCSQL
jgi:ABC-type lipoprotein export system ATPase subunit